VEVPIRSRLLDYVGGVDAGALAHDDGAGPKPGVPAYHTAVYVAVVIGATGVIDHAFHEHWSEDIHKDGVVGGVLHGSGHVLSQTGDDFKRLGKDVWGGIKSIF
jgi:hypothetical protein